MNIKERIVLLVSEGINESKSPEVLFKDYATPSFLKLAKEIDDAEMMNMYVGDAISKKVSSIKLEKEIKSAIRGHAKWGSQNGSSHLHIGIEAAMSRLLVGLRKSVKEFQDKIVK